MSGKEGGKKNRDQRREEELEDAGSLQASEISLKEKGLTAFKQLHYKKLNGIRKFTQMPIGTYRI